jgi:predicted HicB family RNase H-like nuclease
VAHDEVLIQLATRVPKELHRKVRVHCVKTDTTVMAFVVQAIAEKLKRNAARPAGRAR